MSEMERERTGDNSGGIKLDLSVNLPTILTMASMLVAAVLYVNNRFADLSNQNTQTDTRLTHVEKRQDSTDAAFTVLRAETVSQNSALRSDLRADMRDLKQSVDALSSQMMRK